MLFSSNVCFMLVEATGVGRASLAGVTGVRVAATAPAAIASYSDARPGGGSSTARSSLSAVRDAGVADTSEADARAAGPPSLVVGSDASSSAASSTGTTESRRSCCSTSGTGHPSSASPAGCSAPPRRPRTSPRSAFCRSCAAPRRSVPSGRRLDQELAFFRSDRCPIKSTRGLSQP